jgi:biopolymer transport protein ExbD
LGSEEVNLLTLAGKLSQLKIKGQLDNLTIRADQSVKIDLIIKVIDEAKGVGIDKFTIQTEKVSF